MTVKMKIIDNEIETDRPATEIIKLSASSMKTYDQCPKKYYYNYITKEERRQWDHFDLGNLCHKTLEIFHLTYMSEGLFKGSLGKLMSYSFAEARKDFQNIDNKILVEAKELIQNYLKYISKNGMPMVKGVETNFNFNINENILIRGFLDRVDILKDGRFHIVDYKTTKNTKYLEPFQLLIYGMWLKEQYPFMEKFKASYVLLRHNSKLKSYEFNIEDVEKCKNKVIEYAKKINTSKYSDKWAPIPGPLCKWCDFQKICPTQQGW